MKLQKSKERRLALIKSSLDIVVAVGLLQLAPKKVTPRVTGAFGFASSLIACYQVSKHFPCSSLSVRSHPPENPKLESHFF